MNHGENADWQKMFYNSNTTHHGISDVTLWKDEQYLLKLKKKSQKTTYFDLCGRLISRILFSSVHWFSHVLLFVTPWTATHLASLSITNSRSLLKLMSIESVMPSNHLIVVPYSSCLQSFTTSGSFQHWCWKRIIIQYLMIIEYLYYICCSTYLHLHSLV